MCLYDISEVSSELPIGKCAIGGLIVRSHTTKRYLTLSTGAMNVLLRAPAIPPDMKLFVILRCSYSSLCLPIIIKMNLLTWLIVLVAIAAACAQECAPKDPEFLVTFHPHLDAFWLNTDDELKDINFVPAGFLYAMNQRNSKTIFNSMLTALTAKPQRKYFVTEIVFLKDWYDSLKSDDQSKVRKLIQSGQLEVGNAGWVENDEAVCYLDDVIDQYTVGLDFMFKEFGVETKIGWATDSFGHSHSQVALQHLLGFQFQGIERIDDRYIYERKGNPLLEFYWSPVSDSNNRKYGGVLTYIRHYLHEVNDLRREDKQSISVDFRRVTEVMNKLYTKNKHFRFLGNDFEEFIAAQFDKLQDGFSLLNGDSKCKNYKYGNPTDYLNIIKEFYNSKGVPVRQNDFMPNFDQDHYWSGYYTTNPDLKKLCKDFSRLVNLYRKIYTRHLVSGGQQKAHFRGLLVQSDQLLSIMQHHDGITATSKYHIENLFKTRMSSKTLDIMNAIAEIRGLPLRPCNLHQGGNRCEVQATAEKLYFSIMHEGVPKSERIELGLPHDVFYDIEGIAGENIFCNSKTGKCYLTFNYNLQAGENLLILKKTTREEFKDSIFDIVRIDGNHYGQDQFKVELSNGAINYHFNNNEKVYKLSLVKSANRNTNTETYTWNKYGEKQNKRENRIPGIYIMSNDGSINPINDALFTELYAVKGNTYTKLWVSSTVAHVEITIKTTAPHQIDVETTFRPPTREMNDYFLKIDTDLDFNREFYHDMNGYLVSKRGVGVRPDYEWTYKPQDKINANTYPACSFFYGHSGNQKLIVFLDRAAGVTLFDNSFLINIDRLCGDDYKGVGEGYFYQVENTFRYRLSLVEKSNFIEREWQRGFDDALVGYYSEALRTAPPVLQQPLQNQLKYTIFSLNQNEFVLRLFNLAENENLTIKRFSKTGWTIPQLALDLKFTDIKQSFASGVPLNERKSWISIPGELNIFNGAARDTIGELVLSPLQIRSFRINLKDVIVSRNKAMTPSDPLLELTLTEVKAVKKPFSKRCF